MKTVSLLALVLTLGACATVPNPITPTTLTDVEAGYGAAEALAVAYRDSCNKRIIKPSCRTIVVQLQKYGGLAQQEILRARAFVVANPTVNAAGAVGLASAAVQDFINYETKSGVKNN